VAEIEHTAANIERDGGEDRFRRYDLEL